MTDTFSFDDVAVGEFVVDSALLRAELEGRLDEVVTLQTRVLLNSGFTTGHVLWSAEVAALVSDLWDLEVFADDVHGDILDETQRSQFTAAGVTATDTGDELTLSVDHGDDEVKVVELPGGSLALDVNGHQIELTEQQSEHLRIETGDGDDTITVAPSVAAGVTVDGGAGDDTITGGAGADTLIGGQGEDVIVGGNGGDALHGGAGIDTLHGERGNDTLDGGAGNDIVTGGFGRDELAGGGGDDELVGGGGDDTLDGGFGHDYLSGQWGDDVIVGGDGDDELVGGSGDDHLSGERGTDTVRGGAGDDTISGGDGNDSLWGNAGDDTVTGQSGDDFIAAGSGDDRALGGDGDDTVLGGVGDDRVYGGSGDDTIQAGGGDDHVSGNDGDDEISAGDGDDTVLGQGGDDRIEGGTGEDTLSGGDDDDWILGGNGDDTVRGGEGEDYLEGQDGNDTIQGGDDRDIAYGGAGQDTVHGGDGNDYLEGQTGNDTITGGDGADTVSGGAGDDTLDGQLGADRVLSGTGQDEISAGAADNIYVTDDSAVTGRPAETFDSDPADIPENIVIEGTPEFQARVQADLELLASTGEGRGILDDIASSDNTITIRAQDEPSAGSSAGAANGDDRFLRPDGSPGPGSDSVVRIRPQRVSQYSVGDGTSTGKVPPIVTLVHELVHANQHLHGTMEPGQSDEINLETGNLTGDVDNNRELDAVGLEFQPDRDNDGTPDTGVVLPDHPTENSFREELGIEPRTEY